MSENADQDPSGLGGQGPAPGGEEPDRKPGEPDRAEAGKEAGEAGKEVGEKGSGPAREAGPDSDDEREDLVINNFFNFYDQVPGATIGVGPMPGALARRRSGKVAAGDIARAGRYYLPSAGYDQALPVLADQHMVALIGAEGCGRAVGSMMLAQQVTTGGSDLVRLPPSYTLADIAGYRGFKPGQAFLLHDWSPAAGDDAAWFDVDQILTRLKESDAYLIITVDRASGARTQVQEFGVEWSEPDPAHLFRHCLEHMASPQLTDADLARLTRRAAQLRWPRHVVRLAELCIDGAEAALAEMGDAERDAVTDWLSTIPGRTEVLSVTALAFVSGITERRYEDAAALLTSIETVHRLGPDAVVTVGQRTDDEPFVQRRAARLGGSKLAALLVERDPAMPFGAVFRPGFRTADQRQLMIAALHEYYGHELWAPVRDWLCQLAHEPFTEEHAAIGSGLALLAHCALGEVEQAYLDQWSAGRIHNRLLAAAVLWAMADDDILAPTALQLAVSWVRGRGTERAMTAAICLGGPLGQRYPFEAVRWLWVLSQRAERIGRVARTAMARLFAAEADADVAAEADVTAEAEAEVEGEAGPGTCVVPRGLLRKVRPLLKPGVAPRERRSGLTLVNAVLAARGTTSAATAVACVARGRPGDIGPIGELWVMALESAPHRGDAILALHDTLWALVPGPSPVQAAARLGAVIVPRLGPDALSSLHAGLADPRGAKAESRAVISAFLAAAGHGAAGAVAPVLRPR